MVLVAERCQGVFMETTTIHPGSVVVGIDGSDHAARAASQAADLAALEGRRLLLLTAEDPVASNAMLYLAAMAIDPGELRTAAEASGRHLLAKAEEDVRRAHPDLEVDTMMRLSDPRAALIEASRAASTVVVGSRGRGPVGSMLLGSTSVAVVKESACPVLVVRPSPEDGPRRGVLVGVDGTEQSLPVLEAAYRYASARGVPLTVMHCFWDAVAMHTFPHRVAASDTTVEELRVVLSETVAGMGERYPDVEVHLELARGLAEQVLGIESRHHDLVVVGWHPVGPLATLLHGSVAPSVLEHADCPVLVVPGRD